MKAQANMTTRMETITPQIAAEYLSHNAQNNRRIKRAHVEMLARDMAAGEFKTTHQGIAFDTDGTLIDGQHRLQAIMMAGTPVRMMVTRGCENEATLAIDRGATRTVHDAMTIMMSDNDKRSVILRNNTILSAMNGVLRANLNRRHRMSSNEAMVMYDAEPEIWQQMYTIVKRSGRKRSAEMAAYYAALVNGIPFEVIKKFDRVMNLAEIADCEGHNVETVLKWRQYLDNLSIRHIRLESQPIYQTTQYMIWRFNRGGHVSKVDIKQTDCFPVAEHVAHIIGEASLV